MIVYNIWKGTEIYISSGSEDPIELAPGVRLDLPIQTHTDHVAIVKADAKEYPDTDALVSADPSIAVGVRTADCVPVMLYMPGLCVAAVHAGWKGTRARIVARAIEEMGRLGGRCEEIRAFIGPAVCGECYEVSVDMARDFTESGFGACVNGRNLDLRAANCQQLLECGVPFENIVVSGECTRHSVDERMTPKYPSWRRNPHEKERIITAIRLLE